MKNYNHLASELCKLGLNKKEGEVYLVLLEIGYCSVQKIAERVELSRPTVYRVLKSLEKKQLINTTQRGKRNYFIAGSPDAFLNILKIKKRQAEEQEREFLRIINTLQNQYSFNSKENIIEIYEKNQKALVLEKLSNSQFLEIKLISNKSDTEIKKVFRGLKKKFGTNLKIKEISVKNKLINSKKIENIVIFDKIFIFEKNKINIIKNQSTIDSFNLMFDSL
jgi:sugar-specific transcriptional regulator TrmB